MCPSDSDSAGAGYRGLIICDLDGTLLTSQKLISSVTLETIRAAQKRGFFVTICTGRIPEMMEVYSRLLHIRGPFIAANGAIIVDAKNNAMLFRSYACGDETRRLLEFCAEKGFDHVAATVEGCYYSEGSERIRRFEQYNEIAKKDKLRQIPLFPFGPDYHAVTDMEIYKVLVSGLSGVQQREIEEYIGSIPRLGFTSSEPGLLDINAAGISKGTGVTNLARIMGFTKEQICVFGDYQNDISMFEAAGFSVAMGNADEALKNRATVVTGTNDEDGVALIIKKYFLGD